MRPIQWHLKNNWRVPESLEKVIPVPKSIHPHLRLWLEESNVLLGQPLHPLKHALQIFTDASKEGWGTHLDEHTARGTWSLPQSKLHINYLELKAVFLALKEFRTLCCNKTVLIATDNTTVVAYINKEGGGGGGDEVRLPVCPTVENPVLVYQTAGNPQGTSHPRPAERDSRQAIQTWPDHSNRVVTSSRSVPSYMLPVAPTPGGPVCHQVQQQTATFYCVNISYLVDQCICPAFTRSRQTLGKNVLSWALTGTGSVVSFRQVSSLHPAPLLRVRAHAHFLFLFGAIVFFATRNI